MNIFKKKEYYKGLALLVILSLFSFVLPKPIFAQFPFSDNFTDTDGTSLSTHNANWVNGGSITATVENNQLNTNGGKYYIGGDDETDQCASADVQFPLTEQVYLYNRSDTSFFGNCLLLENDNWSVDTCGIGTIQTGSYSESAGFHNAKICSVGTTITAYLDNNVLFSGTDSTFTHGTSGFLTSGNEVLDNFLFSAPAAQIIASPPISTTTVGTPFTVNVDVDGSGQQFNAAQATVSVSSNLSVTGIHPATSNACNLQYTQHPNSSNPSFAGAIFGSSSLGCTVYSLTLTPTSTGTGTITFTNSSIKSYSDNSELLTGVQNGSFTIGDGPTPTPTIGVPQLTVTSPLETYYLGDTYTLAGGKDSSITHVYVNSSETGVTFPTSTTWQVSETLAALGTGNTPSDNYFTIYGSDGTSNTASQTVDVSRHTLGDINGDGNVDLTDASLFASDYGKTDPSTFNYVLSDMNNDGVVDLTDLSILAKLED